MRRPRFRDREAPGSNPGPPTKIKFKFSDLACSVEPPDHGRITDVGGVSRRPVGGDSYIG